MNDDQNDFNTKLGSLAVRFSSLEFYCGQMVSLLISQDEKEVGAIVLNDASYAKKIGWMKELAKFRTYHTDKINNLAGRLTRIRKIRNQFIHGLWETPQKGTTGYYARIRGTRLITKRKANQNVKLVTFEYENKTYSKDKIERLSIEVDSLIKSARELVDLLEEEGASLR